MSLENDVMEQVVQNKGFKYAGKEYTVSSFATTYSITVDQAQSAIEVLTAQGKIVWEEEENVADKAVREALKQAGIFTAAQAIIEDNENELNYRREQARSSRHIYPKVSFDFGSMQSARDFEAVVTDHRLESEIVLNSEGTAYIVRVFELSDKELTTLSNIYKSSKLIKATVEGTSKLFDNAVKVTDFTTKKVVVPVTKIGLTGTLGIGKTLVSAMAKLGGIAVSETVKTSRDTVHQIKDDEAIAIARAELCQTKNEVIASFNRGRNYGGSGITID